MEMNEEVQALLDAQKAELTKTFEESVAGLKANQQELLAEKKAEQQKNESIAAEAERARLDKAAANKDVDTLRESYEQRIKAAEDEKNELLTGIKQSKIKELASGFVSANIVDDPFSRKAMTDEYARRIDIRDGKSVVLDPSGNLTSLSIEDLNQEFKSSSVYAGHIKSTDASGGGVNGSRSNGRASAVKQDFSGTIQEKTAATVARVPALADLPLR
jgi:hypothetical protein|tara:strand:+ start:341 stop:991 length:651 start_codon:yes stop_codon:yes gene_type:complete